MYIRNSGVAQAPLSMLDTMNTRLMKPPQNDLRFVGGAIGLFESKYGERVKVYTMGEFSKEICGGPHAGNTGDLKSFKIKKEEASSAGVRRIKATIGE